MNKKITFLVLILNILTYIDCEAMEAEDEDNAVNESSLRPSPKINWQEALAEAKSNPSEKSPKDLGENLTRTTGEISILKKTGEKMQKNVEQAQKIIEEQDKTLKALHEVHDNFEQEFETAEEERLAALKIKFNEESIP